MIAIIDYNAGNIRSVQNALLRLGVDAKLTNKADELYAAEKVIFPGVGQAKYAMEGLKKLGLDSVIKSLKQPVLGICLGQQLLCAHTEEGDVDGLGIFDAKVKAFPKEKAVPHMGWNNLHDVKGELFNGITELEDFYFVHSYYVECNPFSIADCDYILPFSAAIQKDNFYATQFHPEKSGTVGEILLQNFLAL